MPTSFHLDHTAGVSGTSCVAELDLPTLFLIERFGPPRTHGSDRVTGDYTFVGDDGSLFTLYEYKSTSAYTDGDPNAPSPQEFWHSAKPRELHIGGKGRSRDGSAKPFIEWLLTEYDAWRDAQK